MKSVDKGGVKLGFFRGRCGNLPGTIQIRVRGLDTLACASMTEVGKYDKEEEDGFPPARE